VKQLPVAGVVVGILALSLSSAALVSRTGGEDLGPRLEALGTSVSALEGRIDSLRGEVADAAMSGGASEELAALNARIGRAESGVARLGRSLAEIPKVAEAPARGAEIDTDKLREIARAEIKATFDRFRERGMAGRGGDQADRRDPTQSLREDVGLTEKVAANVNGIRRKMGEEIGGIWRENRGGDRDANRKLMEGVFKKTEGEIAKVLTPEQMGKYRTWNEAQRRNRGHGRRPPQREQPREEERPDDNAAF
jgi:hypothetical protein